MNSNMPMHTKELESGFYNAKRHVQIISLIINTVHVTRPFVGLYGSMACAGAHGHSNCYVQRFGEGGIILVRLHEPRDSRGSCHASREE